MDRIIVGLIVLTAVFFIGRRVYASVRAARSAKDGCASDCGCGTSASGGTDWSKS
ncbi:MAG: FeoB-associated Cys-rich membrane protein [Gemmatimonadaceae bacterium]